jgi:hypothetical protein
VYRRAGVVFGCSRTSGLRTRIGATVGGPDTTGVGIVRLAGADVTYSVEFHDLDFGTATVVVERLTDGKRLASAPAVARGFVESYATVTSLVVRRGGAVAWIARVASIATNDVALEVHKLEPGGGSVLLDRGRRIDATSLRLVGSKLTWTDAGVTRSSTLP